MFAIKLAMQKRIENILAAWFSDLPAINATSFRPRQKLCTMLATKGFLKLKLPKNNFNKKCAPKLLYFTEKKLERFGWFLT